MKNLSSAEKRRWALDMRKNYGEKAEAYAALMEAKADLEDAQAGREPEIAEVAEIVQIAPIIGEIRIRGGNRNSIERPYDEKEIKAAEAADIYVAWEWSDDPAAGERAGQLVHIFICSRAKGPEAQYSVADPGKWYKLFSRGNYGKKYAFGGNWCNWCSETCVGDETPEIYQKFWQGFQRSLRQINHKKNKKST